jgi:ADP-heptose:LPS heptosyltransferase
MPANQLLIIHQGALGDFVATFPAIIRLKKMFSRVDAFCQSELGKLACKLNVVDRGFPIEAPYFTSLFTDAVDTRIKDIFHVYQQILLFSFSEQLKQTIVKSIGKIVHRIPPRPDVDHRIHVCEHISSHLIQCGLFDRSNAANNFISTSAGHDGEGKQQHKSRIILLHPGSGSRKKNWSLHNFLKIEAMLRSENREPEYILGPAETSLIEQLPPKQELNRKVHEVYHLCELVELLKAAGGFIGNDSGVSHLAAFLGLPTLVIFGPSDPLRWKPIGPAVRTVRPPLDCTPCFETNAKNCKEVKCLSQTSPEDVINAFHTLTSSK